MKEEIIRLELIPFRQIHPKTYISPNDFYIYDCTTENEEVELNSRGSLSIKGKMQRLDLNQKYKAELKFAESHPDYGSSYWVEIIYQDIPETSEGQKEYLRSIITERQVDEIYKVYPDENIIELFENDTFNYKLVHGFGEKVYEYVKEKIISNLQYKELYTELRRYEIPPNLIKKIVEFYGSPDFAIQKIKQNSYDLIKIKGIGFKKADAIALNIARLSLTEKIELKEISREEASRLFIEACESAFRIRSGIVYVIELEQDKGHTYIKRSNLVSECAKLINVKNELIEKQIDNNDNLILDEDKVSLRSTYMCEQNIADVSIKMLNKTKDLNFDPDDFIARMEEKYSEELTHGLSEQQKLFFHNIKKYNLQLLIGYAGTGKTMMQKLLMDLLFELGLTSLWLTPTASAAKVLTNYLDGKNKAYTIHRGIKMAQRTNDDGEEVGINEDYIIIDEFSMVDIFLYSKLLHLLRNKNVRILLVGDSFQNVSISCGNILQNMMDSNIIPKTMLDVVFRQKEGGILDIATKIRLQEKFIDNDFVGTIKFGNNLFFHCVPYSKDRPSEYMDDGFEYYYKSYLDGGFLPQEILALSPTKKAALGTVSLNKRIQQIVNPQQIGVKEIDFIKKNKIEESEESDVEVEDPIKLRVGDYIVNIANTYDITNMDGLSCDVINGDTGILKDIITDWKPKPKNEIHNIFDEEVDDEEVEDVVEEEKETNMNGLYLSFDKDYVKFDIEDKYQLLHAWCMTIHKAQGMGNRAVLLVFDKSHIYGLNANMLYVALTRAIENAIVICQAKTLNDALKKFANLMRNTHLEKMIIESNRDYKEMLEEIQENKNVVEMKEDQVEIVCEEDVEWYDRPF